MGNEQEKFLEDLKSDQTRHDDPFAPTEETEPETSGDASTDEGVEDNGDDESVLKPRNRRERRLMERWNSERDSSRYLADRLSAREEARAVVTEEKDYLKVVEQIYGNDTPEKILATELLKKAIVGARDDAKAQAIEELRAERRREAEEARQAERELDNVLHEIEDTYDVTLSEAQERSFFQLLQKMSPKDESGNVTRLADPHAVFEIFQERLKSKGTDNRAKNLAARSMVQSGASKDSTLVDDSAARYLKDIGVI
jgi:hypothetical protein